MKYGIVNSKDLNREGNWSPEYWLGDEESKREAIAKAEANLEKAKRRLAEKEKALEDEKNRIRELNERYDIKHG